MSASGFTPIQLYRSSTAATLPVAGNLAAGELAINTTDEKLYFENTGGTVTLLASSAAAGGTFTTVTATTVVNGLGAVGTPSYTFTGDLNTGMWSPAADTLAFSEGGAEAMRIDSSGNVGIGTSAPGAKLSVVGTAKIGEGAATNTSKLLVNTLSGVAPGIQLFQDGNESWIIQNPASTTALTFSNSGTERMRLTGVGQLLVGTTTTPGSPNARIVAGGTSDAGIQLASTSGGGALILAPNGAGTAFYTYTGAVGSESYTERMRIDSSGNLGIGTSSPASVLDVTGQITTRGAVAAFVAVSRDGSGADWSLYNPTGDDFRIFGNSADRLTITNAGNVGIGTTAPTAKLDLGTAADGVKLLMYGSGNVRYGFGIQSDTLRYFVPGGSAFHSFGTIAQADGTTFTERMRLTNDGDLLLGTTSSSGRLTVYGNTGGVNSVVILQTVAGGYAFISDAVSNGGTYYHAQFKQAATPVGSITSTGSTTAYNTSSDYRLKDIDGPIANSGTYIDALKPVQGSWKVDGGRFIGLLAHEVQQVSETRIATGEKDGKEMQAMDYSAPEIVANLIAEVQSLRARVAQLEGK